MNAIEILAPVGGKEQLIAAVRAGADAVYLGGKGFNARRNAENFEPYGLKDAVSYCHGRGVKVHVTLNTLVMDSETDELLSELRSICQAGADALIVQDLAVARLARECCPELPLHASTQMTIHNLRGAQAAAELGFKRVIPARELSLEELKALSSCGLELECFVHGALCMCVSGGCYLSSILGGRSGNRGLCAQPCRLDFSAPDGRAYALSLKDMSHVEHIGELAAAGVVSFKIEGRMKRPEYVAAAVTACRSALNGEQPDMETLQAVFSRGGFTDGYLTGKRGLNMFGYRRQEDVAASAAVLGELAGLYRNEGSFVPVDMRLRFNGQTQLTVSDSTHSVTVAGPPPEPAVSRDTSYEGAWKNLSRTGGTPFFLRDLSFCPKAGMAVPPSALNGLRREALSRLLALRSEITPRRFSLPAQPDAAPYLPPARPQIRLRFASAEQYFENDAEACIFPVQQLLEQPRLIGSCPERLIGELPALTFPSDEGALLQTLETLKSRGLAALSCNNLGDILLARRFGLRAHGGHGLNILNSVSLSEYARLGFDDLTVSFELNTKDIAALKGPAPRGILAYGRLPLMNMRACPAQGTSGCGGCGGKTELVDRKGIRFPLFCQGRKYVTLLNSVPLNIAERPLPPLDFLTLYFTDEPAAACREIVEDYMQRRPFDGRRTGGLYYRELR